MTKIHKINFDKGVECALLEALCTGREGFVTCEPSFNEIMANYDINWGDLIELALLHKMMPTLAEKMVSEFYIPSVNTRYHHTPNMIGGFFRQTILVNKHKVKVYRKAALPVLNAFKEKNIPIACTKGFVFEHTIHGAKGSRNFDTDIDFMILPENMKDAENIMKELSIKQGFYNYSTGEVEPHPRKEIITYKLSPDHLAPYCMLIDDPVVPFVYLDFACSFTWARSPYEINIEKALEHREEVTVDHGDFKIAIPKFDTAHEFIFAVLHLFREAWFDRWVNMEQDVNLMKFFDIVQLFYKNRDYFGSSAFQNILNNYTIHKPLWWVMEHMDRTFATDAVTVIKLESYQDEEFLFSAQGASSDDLKRWYGSMRDRLYNLDRTACFQDNLNYTN
jgi:hypothetical protein